MAGPGLNDFLLGTTQGCRCAPTLGLTNAFGVSFRPASQALEDNLQSHPRGPASTTDEIVIQKSSGSGVCYVRTRQPGLLRMIERIKRLDTPFDLRSLSQPKYLEETQVNVLDRIRAFGVPPERCRTRLNKACARCRRNLNHVNVTGIHASQRVRISQTRRAGACTNHHSTSIVRCIRITHIRAIRS